MAIFALLLWLALSVAVGAWADSRGRSAAGWFVLALLLSPFLGGFFLIVAGDAKPKTSETRKCPYCAEMVKSAAVLCRYCGKELPIPEPSSPNMADGLTM